MKQESRIPSLDGLRAIAVLFVVFSHLLGTRGFLQPPTTSFLYELGYLGVKVFFVISGYLITNLLLQELQRNNRIHLGKFYFRRTFRIFPACYVMIAGLIVLHGAGWIDLTPRDVFHALSYTSNYFSHRSWSLGHTWSLGVEEQFYLLWPATLVLLGRRKSFWVAASVILMCPAIRVILWNVYHVGGVGHRFETVADAIATGCLLAGTHDWLGSQARYTKFLESKVFLAVPATVLAVGMLHTHPTVYNLISHTIMNLGIALCIDFCVRHHTGSMGRLLNSRPMVFIGVMSYSIYLWQQLFFNRYSVSVFTQFPVNLLLAAGASMVSYYVVERPCLSLRQNLEKKIFARSADAAPMARVAAAPKAMAA